MEARSARAARRRVRLGFAASALILALAAPCQAGLRESWAQLERELAIFDPGGRYLTRPIERRVPGLTVNGTYYLWYDTLVSGSDDIGFRERDFRTLQFQNLLEAELKYRVSDSLQLTSVTHFLHDAAYALGDSEDGLYAWRTDDRYRAYEDAKDIVRELYLSYRTLKLDVVIGKQQIAWGKMDGQFIDVINAIDGRESVQLEASDYEIRRIPMWMANVTYYAGPASINLLWIPDFEADEGPTYGSPWFSRLVPPSDDVARHDEDLLEGRTNAAGDRIRTRKTPGWDFGDHQLALRIDVPWGSWTWGLIYYYAWDKNPSEKVVGRFVDGGATTRLELEREHRRLHHFGLTADYSGTIPYVPGIGPLPTVFRMEALLSRDVPFVDFGDRAAALAGAATDALSKRDTVRAAVALEFAFPQNLTVILQPSVYYTQDWREELGFGFGGAVGDAWAIAPVFFIERPFRATRDRLKLNATIIPYFSQPTRNYQGIKTKLIAEYEFSQYIRGKLVYTNYSAGDRDDLYGQFKRWDNLGIELQYEF